MSYILYGNREAIAEFSSKEKADSYVDTVTLEIFPNGNRKFRGDSLLAGKSYIDIEEKDEIKLPFNPNPPAGKPAKKYILVISHPKELKPTRIDCGNNLKNLETERTWAETLGYTTTVEEILI